MTQALLSQSKLVEQHIPCPVCPSSDAYCLYADGHGYCYSCQYYKPPKEDFIETEFTYEYIPHRGLNRNTLEHYGILAKIDKEGKPLSVGFKYPWGSYKVRDFSHKDFRWEGASQPGLFGKDKFTANGKCVIITEGEYDAGSLYQILQLPCVSVRSSGSALDDLSADRSWVNSFEKVYLGFDADTAGREALHRVAKLFDGNKVFVLDFDRRKDANEYLEAGEIQDLRQIFTNAKKYLPRNIITTLSTFHQILQEKPQYGVSYPFPELTEMTYGIRLGESVLVTAQEKVGKTEFMHHVLYNLLKETGDDVNVGALFIEEPKLRTLQALAGIQLGRPVHLPDCGVTQDQACAALDQVVTRDDRLHLYTHFGSDDPEGILDTIRFLATVRSCRYILLDHIGMVVSGLIGDDERRALDYIITRLEMMVKELNFSFIFVSHVNDFGQTRGSRYIGKTCDLRIDLHRDIGNSNPNIRRRVDLTIPYGRFCSNSGPVGSYLYDESVQRYLKTMEQTQ